MGRNRKAPVAASDTALHISYGGGLDVPFMAPLLVAMYAKTAAGGPSRGEGLKIMRNPDFVEDTDGWRDMDGTDTIARLSDLSIERLFRAWGPKRYPLLKYATPPAVRRGFARHLARTAGQPLPAEPFVVDPARYSSRSGMAFDMRGMLADAEAAERAGRTVYYPMEGAPGAAGERRQAT